MSGRVTYFYGRGDYSWAKADVTIEIKDQPVNPYNPYDPGGSDHGGTTTGIGPIKSISQTNGYASMRFVGGSGSQGDPYIYNVTAHISNNTTRLLFALVYNSEDNDNLTENNHCETTGNIRRAYVSAYVSVESNKSYNGQMTIILRSGNHQGFLGTITWSQIISGSEKYIKINLSS